MGLYDQHLHSRHSFDSDTDPVANAEAARVRGLAGLTFTEHFDTHANDWDSCRYNDDAYSASIEQLRQQYGRQLHIGKGIEICFQPHRMDFVLDFLRQHTFDQVTLSVHYFHRQAVHQRTGWVGYDVREGTRSYLESVLEAVRYCEQLHRTHDRFFDVLGHLDLVKRYAYRFFGSYEVDPCPTIVDKILQACLAADIVPEINTSTLRQGLPEPSPGADVIARYAAMGGSAMALGSDAHRAEDIGADFDRATNVLRTAGIQATAMFKDRKRVDTPLE